MSNCCQHDHHDHDHGHKHDQKHDHKHDHEHAHHDHASHDAKLNSKSAGLADAAEAVFLIQKMDCPTEEKLIRERLGKMTGIAAMQFNLIQRELTVQHRLASVEPIIDSLNALDMQAKVKLDSLSTAVDNDAATSISYGIPRHKWLLVGFAAIAALGAELYAWFGGADASIGVIGLALLAIMTGGIDTLKKGWIALRHRSLNMNFLMSLAVIGAAIIGQWPEAAVVIVLFTLAEMIESLSLDRARHAIAALMAMSPDQATVLQDDFWVTVPARLVEPGTSVRVKPGERIPLDGIVTQGEPAINQAPITGESMPVSKAPGASVFAGTINGNSAFDYRVTSKQSESTLARIVKSVQQAQGQRAPTQRFVDQFARYYIPTVVGVAVLVALIPPLLLNAAFYPWFYKALVLLVIACPCALVISTPITIVSGLAAAARRGILIKGGVYLEQGRKLKALALDKTGTITHGTPVVTDVLALDAASTDTAAVSTLLREAAALAQSSDHPVSAAISAYWRSTGDINALPAVAQFQALSGLGLQADGGKHALYLGNHRLVHDLGMCSEALEARLLTLEQQGKTTVVFCRDGKALLLLAVADTVRDSSAEAITRLHALGVKVTMLSGDNAHTVRAIASSVGITDARGDQLPDDKLKAITELSGRYGTVGMVGDGINDAPALARAQIGFAMGAAGSDTALETADVALMDDDLRKIGDFIDLSKKNHRVLVQNIAIALGIKALFLGLALTGESSLWMAVFADMGTSLIVVFNGLRLVRS
ncbi:Cd2+/Zn2+-exporting ATPase [Herbaspirillum sp. Sphag1AN]|uniref:heavy metal translocating P-type ATPase n=1 Tax=unclassified Herbaspirillum TaxID=2624150 RepID=UPI001620ACB8|nr:MULTISPECIES: heavy metal translocating P-type ATPase [unclassified Herbaspirillum]MBB3213290.1 Cd2+/Zn2+-exporting ATPase [Herbaspirillum sp. Sphag1AN]MBB3246666.1 Cd2+/Zn2+-exporting ATPase [Herbaspirillum sp. Sphag64]